MKYNIMLDALTKIEKLMNVLLREDDNNDKLDTENS